MNKLTYVSSYLSFPKCDDDDVVVRKCSGRENAVHRARMMFRRMKRTHNFSLSPRKPMAMLPQEEVAKMH